MTGTAAQLAAPLRVAIFDDVVAARGEVFHIPGLVVACLIVGYSAWVWRIALAERAAEEGGGGDGEQRAVGSA